MTRTTISFTGEGMKLIENAAGRQQAALSPTVLVRQPPERLHEAGEGASRAQHRPGSLGHG
jgi:hypothetical protein